MLQNRCYKNVLFHKFNTRNISKNYVLVPAVSHSATQRHISFVGPKLYNMLLFDIKNKPIAKVKKKIIKLDF